MEGMSSGRVTSDWYHAPYSNPPRNRRPRHTHTQPQTINLVSNFNNVVTAACMAACKKLCNTWLVSVAADDVGCDNKWVCLQLVGSLEGKHHRVGIVDTNHNGKNFQYQLFGASSVVWMGYYIIDVMLLKLAGVAEML